MGSYITLQFFSEVKILLRVIKYLWTYIYQDPGFVAPEAASRDVPQVPLDAKNY